MRILYIILLMLLVPVVFAATDYRSEKQELVFEKTFGMLRRDESSAATINALNTTKGYIKLTSTVTTINGAVAPTSPVSRMIIITNHTGGDVTISDQSASASAANRFALSDGDLEIPDKSSATFIYDHGLSRWVGAGGGGGGVAFTAVAPIDYDTITKQLTCDVASGSQPGCLASSDFTNFDATYDDVNLASSSHINGRLARWDASGLTGGVWTGSVSGNASTASALAANPADCSGEEWALGIGADGTAVCSRVHQGVKNYVINPGAEVNASTGITATNTTVTRNTSSPLYDTADFSFTIDSATDVVEWSLNSFDNEIKNDICEVSGRFTADANGENVQIQLYRNSAAVGQKDLWTTGTSQPSEFGIYAPCGDLSSATTLRVVGTAATSSAIKIDHLEVTKMKGISRQQVGGTWYGAVKVTGVSGCTWSRNSTTFGGYTADSDCGLGVAEGSAVAPGTKIPAITISGNVGERWVFRATSRFQESSGSDACSWRFGNGTLTTEPQMSQGADSTGVIVGSVTLTAAGSQTFEIQSANTAGGTSCLVDAQFPGKSNLYIEAFKYPADSEILTAAAKTGNYSSVYTPTFTNFGSTSGSCLSSRVDNLLFLNCKYTTGTGSAAEARVSLPSGLIIDSEKVPSLQIVGRLTRNTASADQYLVAIEPSATYIVFTKQAAGDSGLSKINGNAIGDSQAQSFFTTGIPIKGWTKTAVSASITGEPGAWAGTISATSDSWSNSSGTLVDFGAGSSVSSAEALNNNFGTVTCGGSSLPQCVFTPKVTGVYEVGFSVTAKTSSNASASVVLTDSSNTIVVAPGGATTGSSQEMPFSGTGFISLTAGTSTTLKLRGASSAGNLTLRNAQGNSHTVRLTMKPVTQNLPGLFGGSASAPVSARVSGNPGATSTGASPNYPTEDYDPQNMYSAGVFTFPAGKTHCQLRYYWTGDANNVRGHCYKNGSDQNRASDNDTNGPGWQNGVCFFDGTAGDTFNVRPTNVAMTGNSADNAHATCW